MEEKELLSKLDEIFLMAYELDIPISDILVKISHMTTWLIDPNEVSKVKRVLDTDWEYDRNIFQFYIIEYGKLGDTDK